jgi:hypothetical protein
MCFKPVQVIQHLSSLPVRKHLHEGHRTVCPLLLPWRYTALEPVGFGICWPTEVVFLSWQRRGANVA